MILIDKSKLKYEKTIIQDSKYEEGDIVYWVSREDIEKLPEINTVEPNFWQVYNYCADRNWVIIPMDSIDDKVPELSISIDWLMKHSEYGVIERWLKTQEEENESGE